MARAGENQPWAYAMEGSEGARDSGCDSADEFVPVGDLEARRLQLAVDNNDGDVGPGDSPESGIASPSEDWAGGSTADESSPRAGSDEGDLSDASVSSPSENERAFSADGDDSAKETPAESAEKERMFILLVGSRKAPRDGEPFSEHMRNGDVPWEKPVFFLLEVTQPSEHQEDY